MKVCSKCGHRDLYIWLNHKRQQHIEYCRIEDFKECYPQLGKNLVVGGEIVSDKYYYYRLTTGTASHVYRWIKDYGRGGYHLDYAPPTEKLLKHKKLPLEQKRLVELFH